VGDTIKQYASEDATVVVGYVIDPEMTDQIRVTVVATGIGRPMAVRGMPPGAQPQVQVVAGGRNTRRPLENYADLEIPTHMRRRRAVGDDVRADGSESYLDIPAFLRRQAD
jgi:cell division protein FtsZ